MIPQFGGFSDGLVDDRSSAMTRRMSSRRTSSRLGELRSSQRQRVGESSRDFGRQAANPVASRRCAPPKSLPERTMPAQTIPMQISAAPRVTAQHRRTCASVASRTPGLDAGRNRAPREICIGSSALASSSPGAISEARSDGWRRDSRLCRPKSRDDSPTRWRWLLRSSPRRKMFAASSSAGHCARPIIDEAIGESSELRDHSPCCRRRWTSVRRSGGWRTVAMRLGRCRRVRLGRRRMPSCEASERAAIGG